MEFNTKQFIEEANLLVREVESLRELTKGMDEVDDPEIIDGMAYEIQDTYQTILSVRSSLLKMLDNV